MNRIRRLDPVGVKAADLTEAVDLLRDGGIVAYPTETLYGLGVDAADAAAVRRLRALKGRDEDKPILVLVDGLTMLEEIAGPVPDAAKRCVARFWPGPLSVVLRANRRLPPELTAGTGTIGARISSHPVARLLPALLGSPLTSTSANPSGSPGATSANAVAEAFGSRIGLILDAGAALSQTPSTVIDFSSTEPRILREGAVPREALSEVIGLEV
ncbi:L-threonylcarbamoyladenylate synthase [Thermodesulfobacteriota bacterium]